MFGRERVIALLCTLHETWRDLDVSVRRTEVNGQPGALFFDSSGLVVGAWTLDIAGGVVQTIRSVTNPDKLRHLGQPADLRALLRERSQRRFG